MEFRIKSNLGKRLAAFIIKRVLRKKFGLKVKFKFTEGTTPEMTTENGVTKLSLSIEAEVKEKDVEKLLDKYDVEEEA